MESTVASPVRTRLRVAKPSHRGWVSVIPMRLAPYMSLSALSGRVVVSLNWLKPAPVSYTHLDVYKRQGKRRGRHFRGKVGLPVSIGEPAGQEAGIGYELLQEVAHERQLRGELRRVVAAGGPFGGGLEQRGDVWAEPVHFRGRCV